MDLAYLRQHPQQLPAFLTHQRIQETPVGGGSICHARRLTLNDGVSVFAKSVGQEGAGTDSRALQRAPAHFFESEAAGLRWLRETGTVAVPEVIAALPEMLVLEWVDTAAPSAAAARRFGCELAGLHRAGAAQFGAAWPGFIGTLTQDNSDGGDWPDWFVARRLLPYLRLSVDRAALGSADVRLVEHVASQVRQLSGAAEPPARLHGDLWPGNLLWAADRVWLVDPAAHGGHRETDLAQLALFGGTPYLDQILATYQEVWPLAEGWPARVPLHQLHLLLVHTALFGGSYRDSVVAAAEAALRG